MMKLMQHGSRPGSQIDIACPIGIALRSSLPCVCSAILLGWGVR